MRSNQSKAIIRYAAWAIVSSAVVFRIISYFRNRSLFVDTLNLARNYAEKSYGELLGTLDYNQHAPPLFNWIEKATTDIFGMQEYALRLFPLLVSIAGILLFYKISKRFLSGLPWLFALFLFGFSVYLFEYATIAKQYAFDVFFSCLLLYFAIIRPIHIQKDWETITFWAFLGAISIWFSMPMVFVLAGIGSYFLFGEYQRTSYSIKSIYPYIGIFGVWLLSFALLYKINLSSSLQSEHLQGYHNQFFLHWDNPAQSFEVIIGVIRSIVGQTVVQLISGFLFLLLGIFSFYQKDKALTMLLLTPIILCLFAALIHQYSLIIRLTLFLFPMLILIMAKGTQVIWERISIQKSKSLFYIYTVLLITAMINNVVGRSALQYISTPFDKEGSRQVLELLAKENTANQIIYLTPFGRSAWYFYTQHYATPIHIEAKKIVPMNNINELPALLEKHSLSGSSYFIFDSHTFGYEQQELSNYINNGDKIEKEIKGLETFAVQRIKK